jgi:hypothetical protein
MNDTITSGFVVEFKAGWELAAQQKDSRLQATVTDIGGVTGSSFTHNQLGETEANDVTSRLGDTEWSEQDHETRIVLMQDKDWSTPIDKFDVPKLLASPQGEYMQNGIAALNRKKDAVIYSALLGAALTRSEEGEAYGTVAFDTNQAILNSATGMTKAKLLAAKKLFRANECDEYNGETLYMLFNSDMLEDLLADTTLTSADFMAVQMLQQGSIAGKWCGFNWVPYEKLKSADGIKTTLAYTKSSLKFGTGMSREIDVGPRRDKKNAIQIYAQESYGAGRVFENKVVSIDFTV